jgi:hypothetical protein
MRMPSEDCRRLSFGAATGWPGCIDRCSVRSALNGRTAPQPMALLACSHTRHDIQKTAGSETLDALAKEVWHEQLLQRLTAELPQKID